MATWRLVNIIVGEDRQSVSRLADTASLDNALFSHQGLYQLMQDLWMGRLRRTASIDLWTSYFVATIQVREAMNAPFLLS